MIKKKKQKCGVGDLRTRLAEVEKKEALWRGFLEAEHRLLFGYIDYCICHKSGCRVMRALASAKE